MELKEWLRRNENWILALCAVMILGIFTACRFDYYYDLNDDVLMKDILAGAYTGMPEGHNIQMLWPISALISLFYKVVRGLPWYGMFLCGCHFGCLFLLLKRSLGFVKGLAGKLWLTLAESLVFTGLFLTHLVYAQYTVTCTLLAGTAAFLFYTTEITLSEKEFIKKNIPAVLLVSLAYLIRSEMLLLVLPMICVAGAAKWGSENRIFTKAHVVKYLSVIGLILAGLLIGQVIHMIAYGSEEWRTFTEFFNNRTELYDFQKIPAYEENQNFYESIGLSESEQVLFDNYNFGMDEEIDEELVGQLAAYAGAKKNAEDPFGARLFEKLAFYVYRLTRGPYDTGSDYPWNYVVLLGYLMTFLLALCQKRHWLGAVWKLAFLFATRTALWMFILMRERDPERITHSLYLMELCILAAMMLVYWQQASCGRTKRLMGILVPLGFSILAVMILPVSIKAVEAQQIERAEKNAPYKALYQYFSGEENQNNFYLIDVYSSVQYSEKMFKEVDNFLDNYDIMGGWACKSPLQRKKLAAFGIDNMEQALKDKENVYFVRKCTEDMEWLTDYYDGHDTPVKVRLVETVADVFEIYEVKDQNAD